MSAAPIASLLSSLTESIRRGEGREVRRRLRELRSSDVPRKNLAAVASLARRSNLPTLALRLLNPIVRPLDGRGAPAGVAEKAEYAASLTRVGASEEAIEILSALDPQDHPEVLLFQSLALMTRWDYAATVPLLGRYLESYRLEPYQRLIGQVNLTAALIYEREHEEAGRSLARLLEETARGFPVVRGYALELAAQNAIHLRRWREAETFLAEAERALRGSVGVEAMFVRKWQSVLALGRDGVSRSGLASLDSVRKEASERRHWETLRDIDRWKAFFREDRALLHHVYFGTPYESYRAKLSAEYPGEARFPQRYTWRLGKGKGQGKETLPVLDLSGESLIALKGGKLLHCLLVALSSDFYRPARVATLHVHLYPREHFNPLTSTGRVHQRIDQLRRWLARSDFPLRVDQKNGFFSLVPTARCSLVVPVGKLEPGRIEWILARLRAVYAAHEFTAGEAASRLELGARTVQRALKKGVESSTIAREGAGATTRYRFLA